MSIKRKDEHIQYAMESSINNDIFEDINILYNSIPELNFDEIDTGSKFLGSCFSFPILVNAITGGSPEGEKINRALAIAASELRIPMAVGSQSIALKDKSLRDSFTVVRKVNKNGFILANAGAGVSLENAKQAVEMLEANALQLHLNVLQELIMPEGDRKFKGLLHNIESINKNIGVPVVVKEVGFGMSPDTVLKLKAIGISCVDIGGYGGTNFGKIEYLRRGDRIGEELSSIGIPTPVCIHEANRLKTGLDIICGGGIRNGLHIAKAIMMGANAVSIAYPLLRAYKDFGDTGVSKELEKFIYELKVSMIAAGAKDMGTLHQRKVIITGPTLQWINQLERFE